MNKITLSDNHKRALGSTMFIVEKLLLELELELNSSDKKVMGKIICEEEDAEKLQHMISVIQEIKSYIKYLADKYSLLPSYYNLSQVVNSRKSKMWEVLCDTKSTKMKGRGVFPNEYAQEFDTDIDKLLILIECI